MSTPEVDSAMYLVTERELNLLAARAPGPDLIRPSSVILTGATLFAGHPVAAGFAGFTGVPIALLAGVSASLAAICVALRLVARMKDIRIGQQATTLIETIRARRREMVRS